ncbi:MAG TPA: hypothetical protein VLI90_11505, partial [Tepidisphaeraceae bacterium]|nr:hypothetical protein [Tepidisphaeraceae bacterium]
MTLRGVRAIRLAALAAAVSFAGPLAPASHADPINQIATWTGGAGDGKWSSLANWSPQTVPANDANDLYNVIVGNNVNLTFDLPTAATINGISFGPGGSLAVGSGDQLTITNVASLNSSVSSNGAGSIFTATGVGVSLGPNAHLAATAGGVINVAPSTFVYTTGGIQVPVCTADGAGSVVNESTMTSMSANNSLTSSDIQPVYTATNGGAINLSGLLSIDGGIGPHFMNIFRDVAVSETYFVIGANSDINLANLKQITGFAQFTVQRSSYSLPSLQTASATTFNLSAGTAMNLPALVTLAGGTSALNVPNTASFNAPVATTLNDTQFNVSAGGTVNAHNVTTLDNSTLAIAVGGTVDIHSLQEATNTFIAMAPGANLDYTAPIRFDNSRLSITGGASFNVAATSYTYTRNASETAWSADGAGSVISAPSMTSMVSTQSFIGDVRPVYSATNGGVINLSGLQTFNGGAGPLNQVAVGSSFSFSTFFIDSSSNIKLDSLKTLSGWNSFTIQRSSYSFPSLQTMSATTFTLNVGTTVNAPALTTVAGGSSSIPIPSFASFNASSLKTLNDTTLSLSVGGAFTAPQLSTIQNTNITFPSGADFTYGTIKNFDDSTVSISGGAVFNLAVPSYTFDRDSTVTAWHTDGPGTRINSPSTSSIVDTVGFPAYRAINSSMIDLSGLRFALGANTFQANSGGSILFGSLKSYSNFTADGSASSLNFKSLNLTAGGTLVATNLANIVLQGSLAYTTTSPSSINLDQGVLDFAADSR